MANTNFDELLKRYLKGEVTEAERIKIEAWLDVMKTESTDDLELSARDEEKLFRKIVSKKDNVREIQAFVPPQRIPATSWLTGIAATFLILMLASFAVWYYLPDDQSNINLPTASIEKVILEDGTLVWLDSGSNVFYNPQPDNGIRLARLTGSALFEVAKDPEHPFIIQCQDIAVRVVGTSFRINSHDAQFELFVLTGKVEVTTPDSTTVELLPNEKINLTVGKPVQKRVFAAEEIPVITAHTEYNMKFSNAAVEEVLKKLQAKFDMPIQVTNKQINTCRITADLTDHSLISSLERITDVIDIRFEVEKDKVTITGNGCK